MKILLIRSEGNQTHINDFMSDLLLHGLRQLYGSEVIDYPGCWYMYSDEITNRKYDINKIWGKGFTINSTLKNYNSIDRTDIQKKIQEKYFDLIIYASIRRSDQFVDDVIKYNNKVIFIDGEDDNIIDERYTKSGLYFKRELLEDRNNVTITWEKSTDATSFIVETKKNFSMPWISLATIDSPTSSELSYKAINLSSGFHYYRIVSIDRMGYTNPNMIDEHIRVIIEAEVNTVIEAEPKETENLYLYGAIAVILGSVALYGASRLLKTNEESEMTDEPVLIPVENLPDEENNIIESEEIETFSVVPGSQFSRQLMYICKQGCMKEFEVTSEEEDDVMCPHCGTIGDLL